MTDYEYVSIPTKVRAKQWTGDNINEILHFTGLDNEGNPIVDQYWGVASQRIGLWVAANHGWLGVSVGEWILQDQIGFYPCHDEIFRAKYRPAQPQPPADRCNKVINRCKDIGSHNPVCRCTLEAGHDDSCTFFPQFRGY